MEDKENLCFVQDQAEPPGSIQGLHPMSNMDPKDVFVMALRKSANKEELANWTDVRSHYKKLTGRHLNHEELARIVGANQNKTRRELFTDELASYLTPSDPQCNIVRVHFNKCVSPMMFDMGKVAPAIANSVDPKTAPISPFGDAYGYQNSTVLTAPNPYADEEPTTKKMLLLRKDKYRDNLPKAEESASEPGNSYQMDVGRSVPAVLSSQKGLHEHIEKELNQLRMEKEENTRELKKIRRLTQEIEEEIKLEALRNQSGKADGVSVDHQPQRVPTWEKSFITSDLPRPVESRGKMIREIELFLEECMTNEMPVAEEKEMERVLAFNADLPKEELASVGITNAPSISKDSSAKKKKEGKHLMRQPHRHLSCCSIL